MKELKQITAIGMGLLGGSITLTALRCFSGVKTVGYSHRKSTRQKAIKLAVADEIVDNIKTSVSKADLVIIATPIYTFENIFAAIADALPKGCIVTDVGSTKVLPHHWAAEQLPKSVSYVGSHPIAGSEQRGIEFASDDLFNQADCILTTTKRSNKIAIQTLNRFWSRLGCSVKLMTPAEHDRIFANISHLPHITAAALMNANTEKTLKFAGKGFVDTTRIASGPSNIWADILLTNAENSIKGVDRIIAELLKLKKSIKDGNKKQVENLLERARAKRVAVINYKIKKRDIVS